MTRLTVAVVLGIILGASFAASAQQSVCKAEADKYCAAVQPGEGRLMKCLQEHEADLSDACRATVNSFSRFMACIDDTMRLCPNMEPGSAQIIKCLRTHTTDLSTECRREIQKGRP